MQKKSSIITSLIGLTGVFCVSFTTFTIDKTENPQQDGNKSIVQQSAASASNAGIKTYNICDYGAVSFH